MSDNTPPPPNPYEPAGPPQGQPPYGAPPYSQPFQQAPAGYYATWGDRAIATLWDFAFLWKGLLVVLAGIVVLAVGAGLESGIVTTVGVLLMLGGWAWMIWSYISNYFLDQGRTGWTWGKRKVGIRLINEVDGAPVGPGMAFVRYLLHGLINQACYIDYLWPLWDDKNQTLTDKALKSVVIHQPDPSR